MVGRGWLEFVEFLGTIVTTSEAHNYGEVVKADARASNGCVHIIDHVLLPPSGRAPSPRRSPHPARRLTSAASRAP